MHSSLPTETVPDPVQQTFARHRMPVARVKEQPQCQVRTSNTNKNFDLERLAAFVPQRIPKCCSPASTLIAAKTGTIPNQGPRALIAQKTCLGLFSAVSKPTAATNTSCCNMFEYLQNLHICFTLSLSVHFSRLFPLWAPIFASLESRL